VEAPPGGLGRFLTNAMFVKELRYECFTGVGNPVELFTAKLVD
jgi:hypothetical protein